MHSSESRQLDRPPARRLPRALAAAVTVLALVGVAGCGVASKKVATPATDAVTTTAKAATTTTAAADTTETSDTSSDTTDTSSDTSDTTDTSSDTSDSSDTGTAGKKWPAALRDQIISSCKSSLSSSGTNLGGADTCECVVRALEKKYSFEEVIGMGTDSSGKAALTEASKQATIDCIADPTSH